MPVPPGKFVEILKNNELSPLIGVPCSILSPLINHVLDNPRQMAYYYPVNEAHALGLANGFYLGTRRIPVVFMQNSGLGNIVNPLTSLNQIYKLPVFLLISWRGFGGPGSDAPEHDIVGRDFEKYLKVFNLPYKVLDDDHYPDQIAALNKIAIGEMKPVVAVVKKGFFATYESPEKRGTGSSFQGYDAIKIIKQYLEGYVFLSTTGFISRESFAVKASPDFYMMGSMGLVSAIGCGVALSQQGKRVAVLDGDGAILMHLGLIPFIGNSKPRNMFHFILDNEVYASTQCQPTISPSVEFDKFALASGYRKAYKVTSERELKKILIAFKDTEGPVLIWVKIAPRRDEKGIARISYTPEEIRNRFESFVQSPQEEQS